MHKQLVATLEEHVSMSTLQRNWESPQLIHTSIMYSTTSLSLHRRLSGFLFLGSLRLRLVTVIGLRNCIVFVVIRNIRHRCKYHFRLSHSWLSRLPSRSGFLCFR